MTGSDRRLVRHLGIAIVLKLLLLVLLWFFLVRDQRVAIDSRSATEQLLSPASLPARPSPESSHDQ